MNYLQTQNYIAISKLNKDCKMKISFKTQYKITKFHYGNKII